MDQGIVTRLSQGKAFSRSVVPPHPRGQAGKQRAGESRGVGEGGGKEATSFRPCGKCGNSGNRTAWTNRHAPKPEIYLIWVSANNNKNPNRQGPQKFTHSQLETQL